MALTICGGCQRHVHEGEGCPFCGARPRTTVHLWKAAVLTAMVPLGLAACYGAPPTDERSPPANPEEAKPEAVEPEAVEPEAVEPDVAEAEEAGGDPTPQTPAEGDAGGENTDPEGTDTPIKPDTRPARKYGAPPRPAPKYGGPPPPEPTKPVPEG